MTSIVELKGYNNEGHHLYTVDGEEYIDINDEINNMRAQRPNDEIKVDEAINNYGTKSGKTKEEINKLHSLMNSIIERFIKVFKRDKQLKYNVGFNIWIHLNKLMNPYDKKNILPTEYYYDLLKIDEYLRINDPTGIKFNVGNLSPSEEWCEFKSPIEFVLSLLEIILNIKIDIEMCPQFINVESKDLRVINGEYSWVTNFIYNPN